MPPSERRQSIPKPVRVDSSEDRFPEIPNVGSPGRMATDHASFSDEEEDEVIPPSHAHRTLVLCFDGTGDQFDDDNSNKTTGLLSVRNRDIQYPPNCETNNGKAEKTLDSMIVTFRVDPKLKLKVFRVYSERHYYEAGDKICIFGFSRGAYTCRALAGMIHKVGLLPKCNHQQVPFAYKMYKREDEKGWKMSSMFKKAFAIDVDIEFVGVWDTVGSVGVIPRRLPFTTSNTHIRYFRHAIALDEHRARFQPNFFHRPLDAHKRLGVQPGEMPKSAPKGHNKGPSLKDLERKYTEVCFDTNVEEVWFAGCHCDVGGGAVPNETRNALARIPLRWMIRQCFLVDTGIMFHRASFKKIGMDPDSIHPYVKSRPPMITQPSASPPPSPTTVNSGHYPAPLIGGEDFISEEDEDLADAMSPINDMLKNLKAWWLLEVVPLKRRWQKDDDSWARKLSVNLGRGRYAPKQHVDRNHVIKLHRTVKLRMDAAHINYKPKAKWEDVELYWVD
ncbi:T6SS Phospholipase effector Tle1-like catalytic domain-containing protein [Pleurotus pulmonarius]